MSADASVRRRSYFAAGETNNKKEKYDGSPIVLPKYGRNSNYNENNEKNQNKSRPLLRIPKAKYAGTISKATTPENPRVGNNAWPPRLANAWTPTPKGAVPENRMKKRTRRKTRRYRT